MVIDSTALVTGMGVESLITGTALEGTFLGASITFAAPVAVVVIWTN